MAKKKTAPKNPLLPSGKTCRSCRMFQAFCKEFNEVSSRSRRCIYPESRFILSKPPSPEFKKILDQWAMVDRHDVKRAANKHWGHTGGK